MKIADISHYQGDINWDLARRELGLCIFRASVGQNKDSKYIDNAKNCNLPFGAYHYVKSANESEAIEEANFFYSSATASNIKPLFFVADIEYSTQIKSTTKPITLAFVRQLKKLGAEKVGLYIGQNRYPYIKDSLGEFDFIWIPRYGKNTGYADKNYKPIYPCDIWQYTSKGSVSGISGNVDLNILNSNKTLEWFMGGEKMSEKFTNNHFADYCEKWVGQKYWYGTCGYKCTTSLYNKKKAQYPSHYTSSREATYKKHISAKNICSDCVGLN